MEQKLKKILRKTIRLNKTLGNFEKLVLRNEVLTCYTFPQSCLVMACSLKLALQALSGLTSSVLHRFHHTFRKTLQKLRNP